MMSSKNNGFTASDIERYHAGKMSPQERHALEKAALDDPFLADALEGYTFTSTPAADLAKIQSRLNKKPDQRKILPLYRWLSVAALLVIIAGTGWLVYDISKKGQQHSVAIQKEAQPGQSSDQTVPGQQKPLDSIASSATAVDKNIDNKTAGSVKKKPAVDNDPSSERTRENIVVINSRNNQSNAYYKNEGTSNKVRTLSAPQNTINGNEQRLNKVQSEAITQRSRAFDYQRANDTFNFSTGRSIALDGDVATAKSAVKAKAVQNDSIKHFEIVLQPLAKDSQPAMQEVVVGPGVDKKTLDRYPKVTIDTLEPAEGYVKFDDYVVNNLNMPEDFKTKNISGGEVQLAFDVDQSGKPVNITIVKSLCEKCDEEAIRLLKEGPKWKKNKNKKGKITIRF